MLIETPMQFESENATLRLLITRKDRSGRLPTVIMAHGTSATIKMVVTEYARELALAGFAA